MEEKTISIHGLNTFYRDEGSGDGILILHGWGAGMRTWVEVQTELVRRGFRVVTLDLPGFGKADEPKTPWHLQDYARFIHEFANKLALYNYALLGHSFGGRIAIDYATRWPKELNALILVSAAGAIRHKKTKIKLFLVITKIGNFIFSTPGLSIFKSFARKIWNKVFGIEDYYNASGTMKKVMQNIIEEELLGYLPKIQTPTLILWGDKDIQTPISDAIIIHQKIPVSHLHIFPGLPHALNIAAPFEVARFTSRFLKNKRV